MAPKNPRQKCERFRPLVERLEDRLAPSVTNLNPTVNVSNRPSFQSEVSVAINPVNPLNLIAVSNDGQSGLSRLTTYNTFNGGATWTTHTIDARTDHFGSQESRFDPNVAFDSDGMAYVLYSLGGGDPGSRLVVARSDNGGSSFSQVGIVTTDLDDTVLHTASLTTRANPAGADAVFVVWALVEEEGEALQAALSLDGGASFNVMNALINEGEPQRTFLPWAAVDNAGNFHVIWEVNQNGGAGTIFYDVLDGTTLADGIDKAVTEIHVTDFAEDTSHIPAQPDRGIFSVGTIDIDRSGGPHDGRIYISYTDRTTIDTDDTNIFVRISDDGGANWSNPIQVNDDGTTTSQFLPRLAVDQVTGVVYASWYDARNDPVNNQLVDVFLSHSADGLTWAVNERVTEELSDESTADPGFRKHSANPERDHNNYGEYAGLAVYGGMAHPAWTDARELNFRRRRAEEVYASSANVTANGSGGADTFIVRMDATGQFIEVFENTPVTGTPVFSALKSAVWQILIQGFDGADILTIDHIHGDPVPANGLRFDGGAGTNTLEILGISNTWIIRGANAGTVNGNVTFANAHNLTGGSSRDVFRFLARGVVNGLVNGGGGGDWLDYSSRSRSVGVDIGAGQASATGGIANIQHVLGSASGGDVLIGGSLGGVLVGKRGNNLLVAGSGRSILISGPGINAAVGSSEDDLLIAGRTLHDGSVDALGDLFAEWRRQDLSYQERVDNLRQGGGLASGRRLVLGQTVFVATVRVVVAPTWVFGPSVPRSGPVRRSVLAGGGGTDWFFTATVSAIVGRDTGTETVN